MDLLAQYAPRVSTESGGYFNVVMHAGPEAAYLLRDGQWIKLSHRAVARFIEGAPGYSGQPVRLVACFSGACEVGLAQNLANKLGVEVIAPTGPAHVSMFGQVWTSGSWKSFLPGTF